MPGAIASGEDVIDHSFFAFFSKSLGLQIEHRAVTAAGRHQFVVRTEFDDAPMSSHVLSEVERVCDRIGLVRRGELALVSAVADVRRMAARQVRLTFREDVNIGSVGLEAELPNDCEVIERTPLAWTLRVRGPLGPLLDAVARHRIEDIEVREPHLEEVLKTYYQEQAPTR